MRCFLRDSFSFFKEEKRAGLYIAKDYITAASVSSGKKEIIRAERIGWAESRADISDAELALLIKRLWRRHRFNTSTVSFCLPSSLLALKYFKYTNFSDRELESALWLEAEQAFQKPQKELFIDRYLYPQADNLQKQDKASLKEGMLVAAPREVVERHLLILKKAGLYPVALDAGCMAVARLYLWLRKFPNADSRCIINLSADNADFSIISKGPCIYARTSYLKSAQWHNDPGHLIESIRDTLRYYQFKLNREPVKQLILTGSGSFDVEFQKKIIEEYTELPLEFWNPLKDIEYNKKDIPADSVERYGSIAGVSLGLAL